MLKEYTKNLAKEITAKMSEIQIKENVENGTFKVVASDETVDRSGEQIKVSSRDLKNYMKNPIILFWHNYHNMDTIVWKATNVYVENDALIVEWVFAWTEPAQMLRQLYDEWIIKTVSVWFIPKKRDPDDHNIITEAELLELSFVPVPCNPNALSLNKEILDWMIEKWMIKEINENDDTSCMEQDTIDEINSIENNDENESQEENDKESLENDEEKSIKEGEVVEIDEPIGQQMTKQIKAKYGNSDFRVCICEIYAKHFVYEIRSVNGDDMFEDIIWYYDQAFKLNWNLVEFVGEPKKVEPQLVWISKTHSETIKDLISEIKGFWMSNDKDSDATSDKAKIQMQKEALQNVSKVVSDVLHKIKL